ncbi:hypothetical protein E0H73_15105 [Kribbella pittospori]|uniref:Membrane protein ArfC n=1 Tax=Kribbella pittospori TaxID=722689 RepID=A0A4R0KQ59_9ACTN|nr:hypothetical protein E0H73_15105 [Kribbella pittospori]
MSSLLRNNWLWSLLAFVLGAAITWVLLDRRVPVAASDPAPIEEEPVEEREAVLVSAEAAPEPVFSRLMAPGRPEELTLFDPDPDTNATEPQVHDDVPPGRYGVGSADAVPHQGPPDGFTIKGNAQSMLFHTPDSPYYGRTKPEVWFRSEADAERAGFTKYARRPRKSANPGNTDG